MGSGLSMTSVNKIKELAAAREYSLALEIIDSQDLTKSLNPQFVRLCGEVYMANGRYVDARRTLLRAHKMAPEAKRVIYSLVDLYLRMGYKELADFYYRLYMFDAEPNLPETDQIKYIYSKAQGCPFEEIETLLFPMYSDIMDYEWSYELYLLMKIQGKDDIAKAIHDDYIATFKNEQNVIIMEELEQSTEGLEERFYVYSKENIEDDSPEQELLREEEKLLIEADDNRINPKEAQIQILFDVNEKVTFGDKLKYKKHIKEQEKLAKKAEKESELEGENEEKEASEDKSSMTVLENSDIVEDVETTLEDTESVDNQKVKVNVFKKLFSRKKNDAGDMTQDEQGDVSTEQVQEEKVSEETDNGFGDNPQEDIAAEEKTDVVDGYDLKDDSSEGDAESHLIEDTEDEDSIVEENKVEEATLNESVIDIEEMAIEQSEIEESEIEESEIEESEIEESKVEEFEIDEFVFEESNETDDNSDVLNILGTDNGDVEDTGLEDMVDDAATEYESELESEEDMGDSVMQEIYGKKKISIVSELGEDTFINTQEIGEASDSSNPFKNIFNRDKDESDEEVKSSFTFEEVQLQPEDDEYEVDDFSGDVSSFEFGVQETTEDVNDVSQETEIESHTSLDIQIEESDNFTEEFDFDFSDSVEVTGFAESDETVETDEFTESTVETDTLEDVDISKDVNVEEYDEFVDIQDDRLQDIIEDEHHIIKESDDNDVFLERTTILETEEEESESDDLLFEESIDMVDSANIEVTATDNKSDDYIGVSASYLDGESVYDSLKKKSSIDFPEFKSTLFPDYGQKVEEVDNNFDEIMTEAQDKINENLLKEEQMQREAEALLASLGIDLGDIKPTIKAEDAMLGLSNRVSTSSNANPVIEEKNIEVPEKVEVVVPKDELETTKIYSPSRDDLKSSLKIDSVKKSILKQIKEYR